MNLLPDPKPLYKSFISQVPCNKESSLTIVSISFVPISGGEHQVAYLDLLKIEDGKSIEFPSSDQKFISAFHGSPSFFKKNYTKIYLFNLPEGEYYISKLHPMIGKDKYGNNPCDDVVEVGNGAYVYKGKAKIGDTIDPLRIISSCVNLSFVKRNFVQFPIKVEKGKLNISGHINISRKDRLSEKAELYRGAAANRQIEKDIFLNMADGTKWKDFIEKKD